MFFSLHSLAEVPLHLSLTISILLNISSSSKVCTLSILLTLDDDTGTLYFYHHTWTCQWWSLYWHHCYLLLLPASEQISLDGSCRNKATMSDARRGPKFLHFLFLLLISIPVPFPDILTPIPSKIILPILMLNTFSSLKIEQFQLFDKMLTHELYYVTS